MKKVLSGVLAVSLISILYVFQQAKLLEYSYNIGSNQKYLCLLIDRNRQLRYNVAKLERPARLEDIMLARKKDQTYAPQVWYRIGVGEEKALSSSQAVASSGPLIRAGKILLSVLSLDTEAVAKELNSLR